MKLCHGGRHDWQARDLFLTQTRLAMTNPGTFRARDAIKLEEIDRVTGTQQSSASFVIRNSDNLSQMRGLAIVDEWIQNSADSENTAASVQAPNLLTPGRSEGQDQVKKVEKTASISKKAVFSFSTKADSSIGARSFTIAVESQEEMELWCVLACMRVCVCICVRVRACVRAWYERT